MATFTLEAEIKLLRGNVTSQLKWFTDKAKETAANVQNILGQALDPTPFLNEAIEKVRRTYSSTRLPSHLTQPGGIEETTNEADLRSIPGIIQNAFAKNIPQQTPINVISTEGIVKAFALVTTEANKAANALSKLSSSALGAIKRSETTTTTVAPSPRISGFLGFTPPGTPVAQLPPQGGQGPNAPPITGPVLGNVSTFIENETKEITKQVRRIGYDLDSASKEIKTSVDEVTRSSQIGQEEVTQATASLTRGQKAAATRKANQLAKQQAENTTIIQSAAIISNNEESSSSAIDESTKSVTEAVKKKNAQVRKSAEISNKQITEDTLQTVAVVEGGGKPPGGPTPTRPGGGSGGGGGKEDRESALIANLQNRIESLEAALKAGLNLPVAKNLAQYRATEAKNPVVAQLVTKIQSLEKQIALTSSVPPQVTGTTVLPPDELQLARGIKLPTQLGTVRELQSLVDESKKAASLARTFNAQQKEIATILKAGESLTVQRLISAQSAEAEYRKATEGRPELQAAHPIAQLPLPTLTPQELGPNEPLRIRLDNIKQSKKYMDDYNNVLNEIEKTGQTSLTNISKITNEFATTKDVLNRTPLTSPLALGLPELKVQTEQLTEVQNFQKKGNQVLEQLRTDSVKSTSLVENFKQQRDQLNTTLKESGFQEQTQFSDSILSEAQRIGKANKAYTEALGEFQSSREKIEKQIQAQKPVPAAQIVENYQQGQRVVTAAQQAEIVGPIDIRAPQDVKGIEATIEHTREYISYQKQLAKLQYDEQINGSVSLQAAEIVETQRKELVAITNQYPEALGVFNNQQYEIQLGQIKEVQELQRDYNSYLKKLTKENIDTVALEQERLGILERQHELEKRIVALGSVTNQPGRAGFVPTAAVTPPSQFYGGGGAGVPPGGIPPIGGAGGNIPPILPPLPSSTTNSWINGLKTINGFLERVLSSFGRIALFSVVAGIVVRGFFDIQNAIKGAITKGIEFNSTLEQQRLALAGVLAVTKRVTDANNNVVSPTVTFPVFLNEAADLQRKILLTSVETLGSQEELQGVYERVLALSSKQKGTDEDRLAVAKALVNAGHLVGLTGERLTDETRQLFTLDTKRGQLIALILGLNIKELRDLRDEGELLDVLNAKLSVFNALAYTSGQTFRGLFTSVGSLAQVVNADTFRPIFSGVLDVLKGARDELLKSTEGGGFDLGVALGVSPEKLQALGATLAKFFQQISRQSADFFAFLFREVGSGEEFGQKIAAFTQFIFTALKSLIILGETISDVFSAIGKLISTFINSNITQPIDALVASLAPAIDGIDSIINLLFSHRDPKDNIISKSLEDAKEKQDSLSSRFTTASKAGLYGSLAGAAIGSFTPLGPAGGAFIGGTASVYVARQLALRQQEQSKQGANDQQAVELITKSKQAVDRILQEANANFSVTTTADFQKRLAETIAAINAASEDVRKLSSQSSLAENTKLIEEQKKRVDEAAHGWFDLKGAMEDVDPVADALSKRLAALNSTVANLSRDIAQSVAKITFNTEASYQSQLNAIREETNKNLEAAKTDQNVPFTAEIQTKILEEEAAKIKKLDDQQIQNLGNFAKEKQAIQDGIASRDEQIRQAGLAGARSSLQAQRENISTQLDLAKQSNAGEARQIELTKQLADVDKKIAQNDIAQTQSRLTGINERTKNAEAALKTAEEDYDRIITRARTNTEAANAQFGLKLTPDQGIPPIAPRPGGTPFTRLTPEDNTHSALDLSQFSAQDRADAELAKRKLDEARQNIQVLKATGQEAIAQSEAQTANIGNITDRATASVLQIQREFAKVTASIRSDIADLASTLAKNAAKQLLDDAASTAAEIAEIKAKGEKEKAALPVGQQTSQNLGAIDIKTSLRTIESYQQDINNIEQFGTKKLKIDQDRINSEKIVATSSIEARKTVNESAQAFLEQELSRVQEQEGGYQKQIDLIYQIGEAQKQVALDSIAAQNAQIDASNKLLITQKANFDAQSKHLQDTIDATKQAYDELAKNPLTPPEDLAEKDKVLEGLRTQQTLQQTIHEQTIANTQAEIDLDTAKRDAAIKNLDLIAKKTQQEADRLRTIKVPVGDIFANTVGNAVDQAQKGTVNFTKLWKGFTTDLHTAFSDAFKEMLKRKLHFDVIFKDNILDLSTTFGKQLGGAIEKTGEGFNQFSETIAQVATKAADFFSAEKTAGQNPLATYTAPANISNVAFKVAGAAAEQIQPQGIISGFFHNIFSAISQFFGGDQKVKETGNIPLDQLHVQEQILETLKKGTGVTPGISQIPGGINIAQINDIINKFPQILNDLNTIKFFNAGATNVTNPLQNYSITSATDLSKVTWNVVGPVDVNSDFAKAFPDLEKNILNVFNNGGFGPSGSKNTIEAITKVLGGNFGFIGNPIAQVPGENLVPTAANITSTGPVDVDLGNQSQGFFSDLLSNVTGAFKSIFGQGGGFSNLFGSFSGGTGILGGLGNILSGLNPFGASGGSGGGIFSFITQGISKLFSGGTNGQGGIFASLFGNNGQGGLFSSISKIFGGGQSGGLGNILGIINAVSGKGNPVVRGIGGALNAAAFIPGPQQPFVAAAAQIFNLLAPLLNSLFGPGRIAQEKTTLDQYFSKVLNQKFSVVKESQGAAGLSAIGQTSDNALLALGTQYASVTKGSNVGTIKRFGSQFAGNLQELGVSSATARNEILKLAQNVNFDLDVGLTALNKNIQNGSLSLAVFGKNIEDARKNLAKYGDTSNLDAKQLTELALKNGNVGSTIVTLNQVLAGTIALVTQFNPLIDDSVLANTLLGDEFEKTTKSTGLFNDQVANIEGEIKNGNLSIEEAIQKLNELRKAANLGSLDLKAFQLDSGSIKIVLDTITTITQSLHDGVKQAISDGVTQGLSAGDVAKNLKKTLFQAIFDTVLNGFVDGFIKATTTTGPLTAALAGIGKLIADFTNGSITKADFTKSVGDQFKNLAPIISAIADAAGIASDEFKKILAAAGILPDILNEAANNAQALVKAANDLLFDQNLSPLTSRQRLAGQQQTFEDLRQKALLGDQQAIQDLPAAAQAYLENARKIFASSPDYEKAFDFVRSTLLAVAKANGADTNIPLAQLNTLKEIRDLIAQLGPIENIIPPPAGTNPNPPPNTPPGTNPAPPAYVGFGDQFKEMIDHLKNIEISTKATVDGVILTPYKQQLDDINSNLVNITDALNKLITVSALAASSAVAALAGTAVGVPVTGRGIPTPFGTIKVPGFAKGGITEKKETLAVLHGPEAVIPLSSGRASIQVIAPDVVSAVRETNDTLRTIQSFTQQSTINSQENINAFSAIRSSQLAPKIYQNPNDEIIPTGTQHGDDWVNKLLNGIQNIQLNANVHVSVANSNNNQTSLLGIDQNILNKYSDAFKPIDISKQAANGGSQHVFIVPDLPHGNYPGYGPLKGFTHGYKTGGIVTAKEEKAILHGPEVIVPLQPGGNYLQLAAQIPFLSQVLSDKKNTNTFHDNIRSHLYGHDTSSSIFNTNKKILDSYKEGGIVTEKEKIALIHGPEIIIPLREGYESNPILQKGISYLSEILSHEEKNKSITDQLKDFSQVRSIQETVDEVSYMQLGKEFSQESILKNSEKNLLPSFKDGGVVTQKETMALLHGPEVIIPLKNQTNIHSNLREAIPHITNILSYPSSYKSNNFHNDVRGAISRSSRFISEPQIQSHKSSYQTFGAIQHEYQKTLPSLREGGIVKATETQAILHGPEAVIPLPHNGPNQIQFTSPEMIDIMGKVLHALENTPAPVVEANIDGDVQLGEAKLGSFIIKKVQYALKNRQIKVPRNAVADQEF